jgi:hypothetical protein
MAQPTAARSGPRSAIPGFLFVVASLTAFAFFAVPAFIIRPFTYQSAGGIRLAMAVRQQAPVWSLVAAMAALFLALRVWPRVSKMRRAFMVVALILGVAGAAMSRIDYFEWMFHPITAAGFDSAASSKLPGSEMVMAVKFGADARAYPIVQMAYHHVLNDSVGGVPIVVTY